MRWDRPGLGSQKAVPWPARVQGHKLTGDEQSESNDVFKGETPDQTREQGSY